MDAVQYYLILLCSYNILYKSDFGLNGGFNNFYERFKEPRRNRSKNKKVVVETNLLCPLVIQLTRKGFINNK